MKRILLLLALVLVAGALSAAPVIGRSLGSELRVRSIPDAAGLIVGALGTDDETIVLGRSADKVLIGGKSAYWLYAAGAGGLNGWVFGGYLDTGKADLSALEIVEESPPEVDASSALEGGATLVKAKTTLRTFSGLILKETGRAAEVLLAEDPSFDSEETFSVEDPSLEDLCGDSREEILVTCWNGVPDSSEGRLRVYGLLPGKKRYVLLGSLDIGRKIGGSFGEHSASLVREPASELAGGRRIVKIVLRSVDVEVDVAKPDGMFSRITTYTTTEYVYALVDGALQLASSREIEKVLVRQKQS